MGVSTNDLQAAVDEVVRERDVPGAVLGVLQRGEVHVAAAGTANRRTGVAMTPETLFLAGSITKVWVGTAVMSLVDEGRVALDAPLAEQLPGVVVGGARGAERITVRQLLTHTSGLDAADLIVDVGRGDLAVQRYVDLLAETSFLHAPGAYTSYCNAGFVLAGRLLEHVLAMPFHVLMHERLVEPLGLERTVLTPEDALLHSTAIGHLPDASGKAAPTERLLLPEGLAPAGATLFTTAADLLSFARAHLDGGSPLLSARTAAEMASHQLDLPAGPGSIGVSWFREHRGDQLVLSHGGGSLGGQAFTAIVPGLDSAVALFVNSTAGGDALVLLRERVLTMLGLDPVATAVVNVDVSTDPASVCGTFRRKGFQLEVALDGDGLVLRTRSDQQLVRQYSAGVPDSLPVQLLEGGALGAGRGPGQPLAWFVEDGAYLYSGLRLAARV